MCTNDNVGNDNSMSPYPVSKNKYLIEQPWESCEVPSKCLDLTLSLQSATLLSTKSFANSFGPYQDLTDLGPSSFALKVFLNMLKS